MMLDVGREWCYDGIVSGKDVSAGFAFTIENVQKGRLSFRRRLVQTGVMSCQRHETAVALFVHSPKV